jgi:dienelactone hydrolase
METGIVLKKILIGLLVVLVLASLGFVAWASITNPIQPTAQAALQSDSHVQVDFTGSGGSWIVFQPTGQTPDTGLIFYPGGKVDYRAYAPYARAVAERGYLVIIPRMPLNLAVFDSGEAAKIISSFPQIKYWAVGGHSLGGSMAAHYAAQHPGQVQGVVFLASYPASSDSLAKTKLKVVSIYGSNDGLATGSKIDLSRPLLPADTRFLAIQGGNHAQFGDYGVQSGDNPATVSRAEQQKQAAEATVELLKSLP